MRGHRFTAIAAALTLAGVLGASQVVCAQGRSNGGNTPQGRPFQYIQGQISALREQLNAVQTQVGGIEQRLQRQINDILLRVSAVEGDVAGLQQQVTSVEEAAALLKARVSANEETIAALQAAVTDLNGQLALLRSQVAENTEDIALLDGQVSYLRELIDDHQARIASLEQQIRSVQQFLANLTSSGCATGQAARAVSPTGFLVCATAGGGGETLRVVHYTALFGAPPNVRTYMEVSCPAAGEVLAGGGYSRLMGPEFETTSYVSNVIGGVPVFATQRHDPITVVINSSAGTPDSKTHLLLVRYLSNIPGPVAALYLANATCIRLQ